MQKTYTKRHEVYNGRNHHAFKRARHARPEVRARLSAHIFNNYQRQSAQNEAQYDALLVIESQENRIRARNAEIHRLENEVLARDAKVGNANIKLEKVKEENTRLRAQADAAINRGDGTLRNLQQIKTMLHEGGYPGHVLKTIAALIAIAKRTDAQHERAALRELRLSQQIAAARDVVARLAPLVDDAGQLPLEDRQPWYDELHAALWPQHIRVLHEGDEAPARDGHEPMQESRTELTADTQPTPEAAEAVTPSEVQS